MYVNGLWTCMCVCFMFEYQLYVYSLTVQSLDYISMVCLLSVSFISQLFKCWVYPICLCFACTVNQLQIYGLCVQCLQSITCFSMACISVLSYVCVCFAHIINFVHVFSLSPAYQWFIYMVYLMYVYVLCIVNQSYSNFLCVQSITYVSMVYKLVLSCVCLCFVCTLNQLHN
jgi:hypothetical protein